jgi:hypothetical protein
MWTEYQAIGQDRLTAAQLDRLDELETAILRGTITCRQDAVAKLRAVALSFEEDTRASHPPSSRGPLDIHRHRFPSADIRL